MSFEKFIVIKRKMFIILFMSIKTDNKYVYFFFKFFFSCSYVKLL